MKGKSEKERAAEIFTILNKEYPEVKSALNFSSPFQLLIATILSAQCTDERVNIVTKDLLKNIKSLRISSMLKARSLKRIYIQQDSTDRRQKA